MNTPDFSAWPHKAQADYPLISGLLRRRLVVVLRLRRWQLAVAPAPRENAGILAERAATFGGRPVERPSRQIGAPLDVLCGAERRATARGGTE